MKIRQGFVSNSSTTSFCIYGFSENKSTIEEKLKSMGAKIEEMDLYDFSEEHGLSYNVDPGDYAYIGFDMGSIPDDRFVGEWKKEKEEEIKKIFGDDISCSVITEGWQDG